MEDNFKIKSRTDIVYPLCRCRNCGKYIVIKKKIENEIELWSIKGSMLTKDNKIHWCDNPPEIDDKNIEVKIILDMIGVVSPKENKSDSNDYEVYGEDC